MWKNLMCCGTVAALGVEPGVISTICDKMLNIETTRPEISLGGKLVLRFSNIERARVVSLLGEMSLSSSASKGSLWF